MSGTARRDRGTTLVWIFALAPLVFVLGVIVVGFVLAVTHG